MRNKKGEGKICNDNLCFCLLYIIRIGLNTRLSYKDFNDEKEPLDNFVVGLMDKKW